MQKPFEGILGNNSELRTLEFLLPQRGVEYNISELAEEVDVTRQTMARVVKNLEQWGIMLPAKTERNIVFYSVNNASPLVRCLVQLNNSIIEEILGEEKLYEIRDYLKSRSPAIMPLSDVHEGHYLFHPSMNQEVWQFGQYPENETASGSQYNPMIGRGEEESRLCKIEVNGRT
jgi:HTH domain.